MLKLERPIVFFDIESTGLEIATDKIIQLALLKCSIELNPNETKTYLINPGIPIPPDATAIHGIANQDVATAPGFAEISKEIYDFLAGCDLGGYNLIRFDIPLLAEEFARCGLTFPSADAKVIDAQSIFFKKEERTLKAAYKFFCNKELVDAHDAEADAAATLEVFKGQLAKYPDLGSSIDEIHDFCNDNDLVDPARKLRRDEAGVIVFNIGQHRGEPVVAHLEYARWMLTKDFPETTKMHLREIISESVESPAEEHPLLGKS